jgi:Tfp pilus assembly protein PilF
VTVVGAPAGPGRLPFTFHALGGVGRLALVDLHAGPLHIERLELDVTDLGTNPGSTQAEKYQRRRTRLRMLAVRAPVSALDAGVEAARRHLAGLGITQVAARLCDGFVAVRARAADGLAAADITFRIQVANTGTHLRALASHIRVHGHLPTPGPAIADRILTALLGATDAVGVVERPHVRGLCDVEIDLVGALLWHLMPPAGWRLPAVSEIELLSVRIGRAAIEIAFGPPGSRNGELGVRVMPIQLAAAHDLMHSADDQLREGHVEEALRGYRALLAAGGPDQPYLLERILALAAARPAWFFDGLELARQALGRWPHFPAAHAALASITLAQGDAREAASHLTQVANLASAEGDDDQASLAALAGARLLRVLEPRAATELYELALEHDPASAEAADALADRLVDEHRWSELVRLLRSRAQQAQHTDHLRAVQLHLRLADVFAHQLRDHGNAHLELSAARALAPDDPAVHEMTATILVASDPRAALHAWREVARLAEGRNDARTASRAYAVVGDALAKQADLAGAETAWRRALELDALQGDAIAGLAAAAAAGGDHAMAAELYERLRGLGLGQPQMTRHELSLARSLVALGRIDDARGSLRRATLAGGETAAEAHAVLAEIAEAAADSQHAAAELDTAIVSFVDLGTDDDENEDRMYTRAAELAVARATLFDRTGDAMQAGVDWERAHGLAAQHAPAIARDAARTMLARAAEPIGERRWIDAVLATRPPPAERADLLISRADVRRRETTPDLAAALADLHEALALTEEEDASPVTRRRAYALEAELLARSGDARARAQALASLAKMAERGNRVETENAAAAAWLEADEPASALPHGARAHAELDHNVPSHLRREVLSTLGEAAWRQRAWPDVIRAYRGLIDDPQTELAKLGAYRYRLAVAADRTGDAALAVESLRPLTEDVDSAEMWRATTPELRGQALRLFADLAERAGDLAGAATALEGFAQLAADSSPSARADAMYRAGELFRRADRVDDAVRCLEAALRIHETHLPALDALEAQWRERGDLERVSVILGRKVAATARHPARQKPLLSRLGDLQDQLGRPDVALATHQRALEIDPSWRLSLRYVTTRLAADHAVVAAAGGFAQLAGELTGDNALDLAVVVRDRQAAVRALAELIVGLGEGQVDAVRLVALPLIERATIDPGMRGELPLERAFAALARLRGEAAPRASDAPSTEEDTMSGRLKEAHAGALSLRDGARRARAAGKIGDAFAALEAANHVAPGDPELLQELGELAIELGDYPAAVRHLTNRTQVLTGTKKGDALQELADLYYDRIDDATKGRAAMREAAESFGGSRHDSTLRMLASEAATHLAWEVAVEALSAIPTERRAAADLVNLASAFVRSGKNAEAVALIDTATSAAQFDDGGKLLAELHAEVTRKAQLARTYEWRAQGAKSDESESLRADAAALLRAIGGGDDAHTEKDLVAKIRQEALSAITDPDIEVPPFHILEIIESMPPAEDETDDVPPSVTVSGTREEISGAVRAAAAFADRDRLLAAHRATPDDPGILLALLAHLNASPDGSDLRRGVLDRTALEGKGRAQAIALHELALIARGEAHDPIRATALWNKAYRVDPTYAPVWMPFADALAGADEIELARDLYEQIAQSAEYDGVRRAFAAERAEVLGYDDSVVSGEIGGPPVPPPAIAQSGVELVEARELADDENYPAAIVAAERATTAHPEDREPLELLERLYGETGDVTAASEAIGRQLMLTEDPVARSALWRRRAKLYRAALGRDAEAYRCLKEAHACSPADPEIAYQLRTAAMVRGEWALVASLLYREIAASHNPRDRGALHMELALVFQERLDDPEQGQVNLEQALAFDPTIPAVRAPLAKRYESIGRRAEAARLYEEAATTARASDRGELLAAAARCRANIEVPADERASLANRLDQAEAAGDLEGAEALAHQLWRIDPGHGAAFRALASTHRLSGDLPALTELTTLRAAKTQVSEEKAAAWLEVARLAEELGRYGESARAYDLALIEDPGHTDALDARGALAFKLGDWPTADLIYRDLGPGESVLGDEELALRRSIISEHLGRDSEALDLARAAAAAAPGRRDILMRIQELATRLGETALALAAARAVLDLVPLDDDEALLATHFALVDLYRALGDLDSAVTQLDRIVRAHPHHASAIEQLAEVHIARNDWQTAARYLYQLVPLAPSPAERAERLYRLGDAILVHLGDIDRADDVFLRASDLDPSHVPTLRRLLDVYWRTDDPAALVEVSTQLAASGSLTPGPIGKPALAKALIAAALLGDTNLATKLVGALGDDAPVRVTDALVELVDRPKPSNGRHFELKSAATAIAELARRGMIDLQRLRAAAAGTPIADALV